MLFEGYAIKTGRWLIDTIQMSILFYRLPFNWKSPSGYLITVLFEFFIFYCADVFIIAVLGFLVGTCFLLKSFVVDITTDLELLNKCKLNTVQQTQRGTQIFRDVAHNFAIIKELSVRFLLSRFK